MTLRGRAIVVVAGQLLATALSLITVMVLARRVDTPELGRYMFLFAVATALEALSDAGMRFRGVALLASVNFPLRADALMRLLWRCKLLLSASTVTALFVAAWFGLIAHAGAMLGLLIGLVCVTLPSSNPIVWQLRAAGWQLHESIALVVYRLLFLAVAALPVADAIDAPLLLVAMLASNAGFLIALLLLRFAVAERKPTAIVSEPRISGARLLAESWPLGVSLLAGQLGPRLFVIWMGLVATASVVAQFSVAMTVVQTILIGGVIMSALYLPVLGRLRAARDASAGPVAAAMLQAALILGCFFGIGLALAPSSIAAILFGTDMSETGPFLRILAAASPLVMVSFVARLALATEAGGADDLRANWAGLVTGVAAGFVLPFALGLPGLAIAYVCGEATAAVLKIRAVTRRFELRLSVTRPVAVMSALLLVAALSAGSAIESRVGASLAWLLSSSALTVAALAVLAVGPWGGQGIIRQLSRG
jgi:O-antigen/teichoic acid export membrane protein